MASGIQAFRGVMTTDDDTHNRAQAQLQSVMGPITSAAILNGRLVTGVVLTGAGASVIVNHGLGRDPLGWVVVRRYSVAAEPAWTEVSSFLNSWVNYGAGQATAAFVLDSLGYVHLKGLLKSGTVSATVGTGEMFLLPAAYRPNVDLAFAVNSNDAYGSCWVRSTGEVQAETGSNAYFSISGISWRLSAPTTADIWDNNAATSSQLTLLSRLAMTVDLWVF